MVQWAYSKYSKYELNRILVNSNKCNGFEILSLAELAYGIGTIVGILVNLFQARIDVEIMQVISTPPASFEYYASLHRCIGNAND